MAQTATDMTGAATAITTVAASGAGGGQLSGPIFIVDQDEFQQQQSPLPLQPQQQQQFQQHVFQQQQQQQMDMETPVGSSHSRKKKSSFVLHALTFFGIFSSLCILVFVLHSVGITKKSYAVMYTGNETLTSPLSCFCQNLDECRQQISDPNTMGMGVEVTCLTHQVCGILEDNRGVELIKGCISDEGKLCEFIYMNDFKAKKPKFGTHVREKRSPSPSYYTDNIHRSRPSHSSRVESYSVCYCRTHLCNTGNLCSCPKPTKNIAK